MVLVATEESALLETLAEWFSDRAYVSVVLDAIDLVRKLDGASDRRVIVIIDGKLPSIQPGALAVLLETMSHVEVVLCRAAAATEEIVLSASASTAKWTVYREPASLDHVAAECVRLVS
jgi:2-phospho-L-lactate guanylyltransferase (CobY/MobA/RfbA family)